MSESKFIIDTRQTAEKPLDYSWRNQPGGGCLGSIDCARCGCIMSATGSHCFCMGIYTCPRCGYESGGLNNFSKISTEELTVTIQNKDLFCTDEIYTDWYMCPNCKESMIMRGANYCQDCGIKLVWDLHK